MFQLTDNEYLPTLAQGYHWRIGLTFTGRIRVEIVKSYGDQAAAENFVIPDSNMGEEDIRKAILDKSKGMMGKFYPWNPEGASMVEKAIDSLHPPKDVPAASATPIDGVYGPNTAAFMERWS